MSSEKTNSNNKTGWVTLTQWVGKAGTQFYCKPHPQCGDPESGGNSMQSWERPIFLSWSVGLRDRHLIWHTFGGLLGCSLGTETDGNHFFCSPSALGAPSFSFFKTLGFLPPACLLACLLACFFFLFFPLFLPSFLPFFLSSLFSLFLSFFPNGHHLCALPLPRSRAPVSLGRDLLHMSGVPVFTSGAQSVTQGITLDHLALVAKRAYTCCPIGLYIFVYFKSCYLSIWLQSA